MTQTTRRFNTVNQIFREYIPGYQEREATPEEVIERVSQEVLERFRAQLKQAPSLSNDSQRIDNLRLQCIMLVLQTPDEGMEELYDSIKYICDFYLHSAQAAPTVPPKLKRKPAIVRDVVRNAPFPLA